MTASDRAVRTARKAAIAAAKEPKRRERARRKQTRAVVEALRDKPIRVSVEPFWWMLREVRVTQYCEKCRSPFQSESVFPSDCNFCKGE